MSKAPEHPSLVHAFMARAEREPGAVFAAFDERRPLTMEEMADAVRRFAGALQERGFEPGDRVMLALDNSPEFLISWFGTSYAGATMVPLVPDAGERLYERALDVSEPRLAVAGARGTARLEAVGGPGAARAGDRGRRLARRRCHPSSRRCWGAAARAPRATGPPRWATPR